jgi:hypothetical protein
MNIQTIRKAKSKTTCRIAKLTSSILSLALLTGSWLVQQAIAPPIVHAYVSTLAVTLAVNPGETYNALLRRAETVARAAAQRSFDRDILISEVSIIIVGSQGGKTVQVLSLQASREQWRARPDPRRWVTYYPSAQRLLGLSNSGGSGAASPTVTTTAPSKPSSAPTVPQPLSEPLAPTPISSPTAPANASPGDAAPAAAPETVPLFPPTNRPPSAPSPSTPLPPR